MKRLFMTAAVAAMIFTSCKKYEVSEPVELDALPTVKISGTAWARTDDTKPTGVMQLAPAGTVVVVTVPYSDYYGTNSVGNWVKTTTLGSDGKFSVDVPVSTKGVTATVTFSDFVYDVKSRNAIGQDETVKKRFLIALPRTVDIHGQSDIPSEVKVTYTRVDYAETDEVSINPSQIVKVPVSGKFEYWSIDSLFFGPGKNKYVVVPTGTKVRAVVKVTLGTKTYTEVLPIIEVGAAGTYTIQVPTVPMGESTISFYAEGFWTHYIANSSATKKYLYRYVLDDMPGGNKVYAYSTDPQNPLINQNVRFTLDAELYEIED